MSDEVEDFLAHYGIKGMKWGQKKARGDGSVQVSAKATSGKAKIKVSGGGGDTPHPDALGARVSEQRLKKSGINALSNQELQHLQNRLNLEQNVKRLSTANVNPAKKFAAGLVGSVGKQQVTRVANEAAAKKVGAMMAGK